jgi:ribosome-associated toxin RatA of RatAB toxin-antitoxin module
MKTVTLFLFLSFLVFSMSEEKNGKSGYWELIKNEDGIKAFTRKAESSDIKQVKVITNIKSTLSALVAIVRDVKSHPKWIYRCKKAETLKKLSNTEIYYYNETEAPWPVSNRDIVTHALIKQDEKTKIVTITSTGLPEYIPPKKDIVRIKKLNSKWIFIPKSDGTVDVTSLILIDLGGELPAWIVNMAVADGPFETVYKMKREVVKAKYQKIFYDFIEE